MKMTYGEALRQVFADFERGELSWFEYTSRKAALLRDSKCRLNKDIPSREKRIAVSLTLLGLIAGVTVLLRGT